MLLQDLVGWFLIIFGIIFTYMGLLFRDTEGEIWIPFALAILLGAAFVWFP